MQVLVPVDGSDCSMRALRFATEFARRFDATLDVVHFTDSQGPGTDELRANVEAVLEAEGLDGETELVGDVRLSDFGASTQVGKDILSLVEERGYDHVVMGHHGTGRVGKLILGSAAETVTRATTVPATVVP
ncbi:MAG: universal stress protein [Haloplanus sp.]